MAALAEVLVLDGTSLSGMSARHNLAAVAIRNAASVPHHSLPLCSLPRHRKDVHTLARPFLQPSRGFIQRHSRAILGIGEDPRFQTSDRMRSTKQHTQDGGTDSGGSAIRRNRDFVNPHLARLIRVDVVDGGCKADDVLIFYRHCNVEMWVDEKCFC